MDETRTRLFFSTVIRPDASRGGWWLLDNQRDGFGAYGYHFRTLLEITQDYAVLLGERGEDEHGMFYRAVALDERGNRLPTVEEHEEAERRRRYEPRRTPSAPAWYGNYLQSR